MHHIQCTTPRQPLGCRGVVHMTGLVDRWRDYLMLAITRAAYARSGSATPELKRPDCTMACSSLMNALSWFAARVPLPLPSWFFAASSLDCSEPSSPLFNAPPLIVLAVLVEPAAPRLSSMADRFDTAWSGDRTTTVVEPVPRP